MAVSYAWTQEAAITSGGPQDVTKAGYSDTPKAAVAFVNVGITNGTAAAQCQMSVGFVDFTTSVALCGVSEDAAARCDDLNTGGTGSLIRVYDETGTVLAQASAAAISGGVRLTWSTYPPAAWQMSFAFFGGTSTTAKAGTYSGSGTQDSSVNVQHAVGETTDLLFLLQDPHNSPVWVWGTNAGDYHQMFGCWARGNNNQACIAHHELNNQADGAPNGLASQYGGRWNTTGLGYAEEISTHADGFTSTCRLGSDTHEMAYLSIHFGGDSEAELLDYTVPASGTTDAITGLSWEPGLAIFGLTNCQSYDTVESDADGGVYGIGGTDGDEESCCAVAIEDASATTNTQSLADAKVVNISQDDGTAGDIATWTSFDSTGLTITYSNHRGTASKGFVVCVQTTGGIPPVSITLTPAVATFEVPSPSLLSEDNVTLTPAVATFEVPSPSIDAPQFVTLTPAVAEFEVPSPSIDAPQFVTLTPAVATFEVPALGGAGPPEADAAPEAPTIVQESARTVIPLDIYVDQPERLQEQDIHGALRAITTGAALDPATPINITKGHGKIYIVLNAGSDVTGTIHVYGTIVDRYTGNTTAGFAEVLTVTALSTDNSTTDADGNTIHDLVDGYITSQWFTGAVAISASGCTFTDVDVYHVSFEQMNDLPRLRIDTFDVTVFTSNASAWVYAYLYTVLVTGQKANIQRIATLSIPSGTAVANRFWRLRRGALGQEIDGTKDGFFVDFTPGPSPNQYVQDMTCKIWVAVPSVLYGAAELAPSEAEVDPDTVEGAGQSLLAGVRLRFELEALRTGMDSANETLLSEELSNIPVGQPLLFDRLSRPVTNYMAPLVAKFRLLKGDASYIRDAILTVRFRRGR
jgi:hypothetical protein